VKAKGCESNQKAKGKGQKAKVEDGSKAAVIKK
jgi:hypothetical protein